MSAARTSLVLLTAGTLASGTLTAGALGAGTAAATSESAGPAAGAKAGRCPSPPPLRFGEPSYVDTHRAGGEPTVEMHPSGRLLYSAHAGTTHVYGPEAGDEDSGAFAENYRGQAHYWYSDDLGKTWHFSDRTLPPNGVPGSGFSDPEFAVDQAGQVYISEINLANVAVSKSTDDGETYELQNLTGQTMEDRQWMAADEKDVLYMTGNLFAGGTFPGRPVGGFGHHLFKSTDGGKTFSHQVEDPGGLGDIKVDKDTGTVYETHLVDDEDGDETLQMAAFRDARKNNLESKKNTIADDVSMGGHWPAFDIDEAGNLYVTWAEDGQGDGPDGRPAGVYYAYSTDGGRSWGEPVRVDTGPDTDIWPWIAVGDTGRVAIAWLQADKKLPGNDPETAGDHGWRVTAAATLNGLGCPASPRPGFRVATATPEPVHTGTICDSGTVCQAQGVDRRMGDFFTIEVDNTGRMWAGYSDTRRGGMVSLPGFVRQTGGPRLVERGNVR